MSSSEDAKEQAKYLHECSYPCCNYSTFHKAHLKTHFKRVHLKEKGKHHCTQCPKIFHSKRFLEEHTNGVHLNIKSLQCDYCEFATAYRSILNEHVKVAHGTQKYDCPHCDHFARYKGNLDKHIYNIHRSVPTSLSQKDLP